MIFFHVSVVTSIQNYPIRVLRDKQVTWEENQVVDLKKVGTPVPKRFGSLNPDGAAEVRVAVEEKLNGPPGSYSSVAVRVEIQARCEQTQEGIEQARNALFREGMKALEHYIMPARTMLDEHFKRWSPE